MTKPNSALQAGGDETPVAQLRVFMDTHDMGQSLAPNPPFKSHRIFVTDAAESLPLGEYDLFTRPTPAAAAGVHQKPRPFDPGERTHHAALQRIGYALGLLPGADLHEECVPAIEALRAAAAGVPKPSARASYARDITPTEDVDNLARMAWFVGRMSDPDDDTYTPSPGMLEVIGRLNEVFASPVAPAGVPTDEQILHLWDTHVGEPTARHPLTERDKLRFARAVLSAGAPAVPLLDEQDSVHSHLAAPGSTVPSATSRGQAVGNGDGAPTQPERSPRELSDAALIDAFIAHNEQFSRSSDHPAWLHCKDGDGNSTSLRGDLFAAALRNLLTGEQA